MSRQPLVLTLRLDKATEHLLTGLRTKHFPSHRNFLPAHITLFHALPSSSQQLYITILTKTASQNVPFTVGVKSPFPLGKKGVGINIASHKLRVLHAELADELHRAGVELTDQDQRKLSPHVTVQNKVDEKEARETLEALKVDFEERSGTAEGLVLWRYEVGGSWTFLREFGFGQSH